VQIFGFGFVAVELPETPPAKTAPPLNMKAAAKGGRKATATTAAAAATTAATAASTTNEAGGARAKRPTLSTGPSTVHRAAAGEEHSKAAPPAKAAVVRTGPPRVVDVEAEKAKELERLVRLGNITVCTARAARRCVLAGGLRVCVRVRAAP
jgi:hypothetical protein